MPTPYRDETDALTLRLDALLEKLEAVRVQTRELHALTAAEREIEREVEVVRQKLARAVAGRPISPLDDAKIASPCPASWDEMIGDDRTRLCLQCDKEVHNLAGMTREEAEAFLGGLVDSVCLRIFRRADGTVITADCPVGVQKKRRRLAVVGAAVGGVVSATAYLAMVRAAIAPPADRKISEAPTASPSVTEAPTALPSTTAAPTSLPHTRTAGVAPRPNLDRQLSYQTQELSRLLDKRAKTTDAAERRDIESRIKKVQQSMSTIRYAKRKQEVSL